MRKRGEVELNLPVMEESDYPIGFSVEREALSFQVRNDVFAELEKTALASKENSLERETFMDPTAIGLFKSGNSIKEIPEWGYRLISSIKANLLLPAIHVIKSNGTGMPFHVDNSNYGPSVIGLTLMRDKLKKRRFALKNEETGAQGMVYIGDRDIYLLSGPARNKPWMHGTPNDTVAYYSITIRELVVHN